LLIDSHAHLDSVRYAEDREEVLRRAWQAGVETILSIGIGENSGEMAQALEICRQFNAHPDSGHGIPRLYASAGVYPHNTPEVTEEVLARLDQLLTEPEVIACGEIGLDYYYDGAPHEIQKQMLAAQMEVAARRKRPILIHCRPKDGTSDAFDDLFQILEAHWRSTGLGGILHCFSGNAEQAKRLIEMGFLISFAGNLTFQKAKNLRKAAQQLPLESLLVETDAPWLAPMPHRGNRNESSLMLHTAQLLADLHGLALEELATITTKNFRRMFPLGADVGNC
jgi:TatD DNase family protein